jgi:predicted enzyme related to lactoylglutathione lyase
MSAVASRVIAWFEIPSTDFDRAVRFYETILGTTLRRGDFGQPMAVFNYGEQATGGCIVGGNGLKPSAAGTLVYLNAEPTVDVVLARVEQAGGKVEGPAIQLPQDIGFIGFFTDTEGNRVGLHSPHNG